MSDEDFDLDTDDEVEDNQPKSDPFKQLRMAKRAADKQLREQTAELEELRQYRAQQESTARASAASEKFATMGLSPKQAKLFLKENPDAEISDEAIIAFAREYDLALFEDEPEPPKMEPTFRPVSAGGSAPRNKLTRAEFEELKHTDMSAAAKAAAEGRVEGFKAKVARGGEYPAAETFG